MLLNTGPSRGISRSLGYYGIDLGQVTVAGFRIDPFFDLDQNFQEDDIGLLTYLIFDAVDRCCTEAEWRQTSFIQDRVVYTILEQCPPDSERLLDLVRQICDTVLEEDHFSVSAGISNTVDLPEKLAVCRKEVKECLAACDCLGNRSVVSYSELDGEQEAGLCETPSYENLLMAVRGGASIEKKASEFAEALRQCGALTVAQRVSIQGTLEACQVMAEQYGETDTLTQWGKQQVEKLLACSTVGILAQLVAESGRWIQEYLNSQLDTHQLAVVNAAKEYIIENCSREIQLEEVASQIYVSKWYLSKLFKQVTGVGFNNFVAETRIDCAKKLIRENPHLKNYEVAERLGFGSVRYFSQLFKKITGMTPSEYRG